MSCRPRVPARVARLAHRSRRARPGDYQLVGRRLAAGLQRVVRPVSRRSALPAVDSAIREFAGRKDRFVGPASLHSRSPVRRSTGRQEFGRLVALWGTEPSALAVHAVGLCVAGANRVDHPRVKMIARPSTRSDRAIDQPVKTYRLGKLMLAFRHAIVGFSHRGRWDCCDFAVITGESSHLAAGLDCGELPSA
jgi:hypothetical protein